MYGERYTIGLEGELFAAAIARLEREIEAAGRKWGGAAISDRDVAIREAGADAAGCTVTIVLDVDVLNAELTAGGDVVLYDRRVDELNGERQWSARRRAGCCFRAVCGATGQFLDYIFKVAAIRSHFQVHRWPNDFRGA